MSDQELKPCPLCEGKCSVEVHGLNVGAERVKVGCSECFEYELEAPTIGQAERLHNSIHIGEKARGGFEAGAKAEREKIRNDVRAIYDQLKGLAYETEALALAERLKEV